MVIGHVRTATNSFQKMVQSLLLLIKQTLIFFLGEKSCSKEEKVTSEQNEETGWHILKYHIRENIAFADGLIAFVIAKLKPKRILCTIVLKCYPGSIPVANQIKGCILMWGVSTSFMSFYYPEFYNEPSDMKGCLSVRGGEAVSCRAATEAGASRRFSSEQNGTQIQERPFEDKIISPLGEDSSCQGWRVYAREGKVLERLGLMIMPNA